MQLSLWIRTLWIAAAIALAAGPSTASSAAEADTPTHEAEGSVVETETADGDRPGDRPDTPAESLEAAILLELTEDEKANPFTAEERAQAEETLRQMDEHWAKLSAEGGDPGETTRAFPDYQEASPETRLAIEQSLRFMEELRELYQSGNMSEEDKRALGWDDESIQRRREADILELMRAQRRQEKEEEERSGEGSSDDPGGVENR